MKLQRITHRDQLIGGQQYTRIIINHMGEVHYSKYEILGRPFRKSGGFMSAAWKVRVRIVTPGDYHYVDDDCRIDVHFITDLFGYMAPGFGGLYRSTPELSQRLRKISFMRRQIQPFALVATFADVPIADVLNGVSVYFKRAATVSDLMLLQELTHSLHQTRTLFLSCPQLTRDQTDQLDAAASLSIFDRHTSLCGRHVDDEPEDAADDVTFALPPFSKPLFLTEGHLDAIRLRSPASVMYISSV